VTLALVLLGAAVGAPLRYVTDLLVQSRHDSVLPWGTLVVNVGGSLVLGVAAGALPDHQGALALVGTGFCGALTTFSTFGFETVRLAQEGWVKASLANVVLSVGLSLAACALGWWAAAAVV
jgi:CrcB protein